MPETGTWFRAIQPGFLPTALQTSHTRAARSRYNPGYLLPSSDRFAILYLAADPVTALFEFEAIFGDPASPVVNPTRSTVLLNVQVVLQSICDLTDVADAQTSLDTTAQELTGDWRGYETRGLPGRPISSPTGPAPTQELGTSLFQTGIEGFWTISAKLATNRNLAVFPDNLRPGSRLVYRDNTGQMVHQIP